MASTVITDEIRKEASNKISKSLHDIFLSKIEDSEIEKVLKGLETKAFSASKTIIDYRQNCKEELAKIRKEFATCEFNIAVLGSAEVGKTSLCLRLSGKEFNRKAGYKATLGDAPEHYVVEVSTSLGKTLIHLYDWGWAAKQAELGGVGSHLAKARDGAIFVLSVTHKTSKTDFPDFFSMYERAVGFDRPLLILSNKNDQKKKAVSDGEAASLCKGKDRAYVPISLADDVGIDEAVESLCRLLFHDTNLTISGVKPLTLEEAAAWMKEKVSSILS